MRRKFEINGRVAILPLAALALLTLSALFILCQGAQAGDDSAFPQEDFVQINPTLPNSRLNFDDDSQESCCAKNDVSVQAMSSGNTATSGSASANGGSVRRNVAHSEFEKSNPRYLENSTPAYLVTCDRFAEMPENAANSPTPIANFDDFTPSNSLPIESYSTNVSLRQSARYYTNPAMHVTSDFHIETAGGSSQIKLRDVNSYSVCMAQGNNVALVANTDGGSILSYNGNDHIYLAGNNTNMLTRTGAGEDTIEIFQARPQGQSATSAGIASADTQWTAFNIYKTAISGGAGTDTLVVKGTPWGTKWCHIGGYKIYGEYFYVVEFALPPTVTEGPRRQRVNIGESIEFVMIKGKKYRLNDFLVHGQPMDSVARSVPIGDPLPRVAIRP